MKLYFKVLVCFVSLFISGVSLSFASPEIRFGGAVVSDRNSWVDVPVFIFNDGTAVSVQFELTFPAGMRSGDTKRGDQINHRHGIASAELQSGTIRRSIIIPPVENPLLPDGVVAYIPLLVDSITPGNPVRLPISGIEISDANEQPILDFTTLEGLLVSEQDQDLDSDGDGMPDIYEINNRLHPLDPDDRDKDYDEDGLTNFQEFEAGTDPWDYDTNDNGLNDFWEATRTINEDLGYIWSYTNTKQGITYDLKDFIVDDQGNSYLVGNSFRRFGTPQGFVEKINNNGQSIWKKFIARQMHAIAIDPAGSIYISGSDYVDSTTRLDSFVAKLDLDGNEVWSQIYGDVGKDIAKALAFDSVNRSVYVSSQNHNLDNLTLNTFVKKLDEFGNTHWMREYGELDVLDMSLTNDGDLVFVGKRLGGRNGYVRSIQSSNGNELWLSETEAVTAYGVTVDEANHIIAVSGNKIAIYAPNDGAELSSFVLNHSDYTDFRSVAVNSSGSIYATGYVYQDKSREDILLAKFGLNGSQVYLEWSETFVGNDKDIPVRIRFDTQGNVYLAGNFFDRIDLNPSYGNDVRFYENELGFRPIFLTKFSTNILSDQDGDTVPDFADAFPNSPDEWQDDDLDGIGNNEDDDDDNDGVINDLDAFPNDPFESIDTDGDGIGNNADDDDDEDGFIDIIDAFPLNPSEHIDTDGDGIGNNEDPDDDNDGIPDVNDGRPLSVDENIDTDGDGVVNAFDEDDDNDGLTDLFELIYGYNTLVADTNGNGVIDGDEDADGDGLLNRDEDRLNANPNMMDTDGDGLLDNDDPVPDDKYNVKEHWRNEISLPYDDSAIDTQGNLYVVGRFFAGSTVDFDPSDSIDERTAQFFDFYISKYAADGGYLWTKTIGGSDAILFVSRVAVDINNNIVVTGIFSSGSADFDPDVNSTALLNSEGNTNFVAKYDENGSYQWAGQMRTDTTKVIGVDNQSNIFLAGFIESSASFSMNPFVPAGASVAGRTAYVVKYDPQGVYQWHKLIEQVNPQPFLGPEVTAINFTDANDVIFAGSFPDAADLDPSTGTVVATPILPGRADEFVVKLTETGDYVWSNSFGGTEPGNSTAIAIDDNNNVYVSGNIGIQKLDAFGQLVWSDTLHARADSIVISENGNIWFSQSQFGTTDLYSINPQDSLNWHKQYWGTNGAIPSKILKSPSGAFAFYMHWSEGTQTRLSRFSVLDSDGDTVPDYLDDYPFDFVQTLNPDSDSDGMPSLWELDNGLDPQNSLDSGIDNDSDGLVNIIEFQLGTDPQNSDSDMDLIPDGFEVIYGLNPLSTADAPQDTDLDGLTNLQEFQANTNPLSGDSDSDDMPDKYEVDHNLAATIDDSGFDSDGDGLTNIEEFTIGTNPQSPDSDNDTVIDSVEVQLGTNPTISDSDGDGCNDAEDQFPLDNQLCTDTDGDGVDDSVDRFPNDPTEWLDSDDDGVGDNSDRFPNNGSEWIDSDTDGVGDNSDAFPFDSTEWVDTDSDGVGDNSDAFPNNPLETVDTDGDGVGDNTDQFPTNTFESVDTDGDGVGDNTDLFINDPFDWADNDSDGVGNNRDDFPSDPSETVDTDGDGIGNNADTDDDNDTLPDSWELQYGLDPLAFVDGSLDTDFDGLINIEEFNKSTNPNIADTDNDGVNDSVDVFPLDSSEQSDFDGDGTGDVADTDDDNDTMPDTWEIQFGLNPFDNSDAGTNLDGDCLVNLEEFQAGTDPTNPDSNGDGVNDGCSATPPVGGGLPLYHETVTYDSGTTIQSTFVDANGKLYVAGLLTVGSHDLDRTNGMDNRTVNYPSLFISQYHADGSYGWTQLFTGFDNSSSRSINEIIVANNSVYVAGSYSGTMDLGEGAQSVAGFHGFVLKISDAGVLQWIQSLGGSLSSDLLYANSIALDSASNIYIAGIFRGEVDFDSSSSVINHRSISTNKLAGYLLQLDPSGQFNWVNVFDNGIWNTYVNDVIVTPNNSVIAAGQFGGTIDFSGTGVGMLTSAGGADSSIVSFDSNGQYQWGYRMGGTNTDYALKLNSDGNDIYILGEFYSINATFGPNAEETLNSNGNKDIYVSKISDVGSYQWTRSAGGSGIDTANGIGIASNGNVFVTGKYRNTVHFDPSGIIDEAQLTAQEYFGDQYLWQLDSNGEYLNVYSTTGSPRSPYPTTLSVSPLNNSVYIGGYMNSGSVDFNPDPAQEDIFNFTGQSGFINRFQ